MSPAAPLKVAYFLSPSAHFAGIERVVHELATGLAQAHPLTLDVHVVFSSDYDEEALRSTAYTRHVLDVARLLDVPRGLRRVVARHGFDVVVVPQIEATVIVWSATRGLDVVVVPHLHGNPQLEREEATRRTRAAFVVFDRVVARRVPLMMAVSPSLRDYVAANLARGSRVVFAKNPVRDLGEPAHVPSPDGRFRFVCVARLTRQKGQDDLLRAVALARPDLPPFVLTLVGQGDAEADLRALCTALGLDDVVRFAGYAADPVAHLQAADCFVLASRWEGFGVALVEALQCGLPVVATDCDYGPGDIIIEPALGVLVPPGDPAALARGLIAAAAAVPQEADRARRREVARGYRPEAAVENHYSILRSVAPPP